MRHLLWDTEPAGHIEMNEGRAGSAGTGQARGHPDLPVRRGSGGVQPELAQRAGHAQDEQGLGFLRAQAAEREAVSLDQLAATAGPGLRPDRDAGAAEGLEVPVDGPHADLEFRGERHGGHPAPGLEQQHQGHQPVGAHPRRLDQIADMRCQ